MTTLIIYFSQTGNTRTIAEQIGNGIMSVTGQCELKSLHEVDKNSLAGYDLVGLGCPVFYYQEPLNVRDFIEGLPHLIGQRWFIFCTHGSIVGNTFPSISGRLQKKGVLVVGYHDSYADGSLPFYPYPTLTTGHPDEFEKRDAYAFGMEIAVRSQRVSEGDNSLMALPKPVPEEWVRTSEMWNLEFLKRVFPKIRIDIQKCAKCRECQDNCPVKGIDVDADPPRIQEPCIFCWNCAKICPSLAIETDWDALVAMAPSNYSYFRQVLDKAAASGEFRWLIDPDSINFADPLYKQRERKIREKQSQ